MCKFIFPTDQASIISGIGSHHEFMFIFDTEGYARFEDVIAQRKSSMKNFNIFVTSPNHFSLDRVAEREKQMYMIQ